MKNIAAALAAALLAVASAYADDSQLEIKQRSGAGDSVAGKGKSALCQSCHGENGNSAASSFPKLAGQYSDYIQRQVWNFGEGSRNDPAMSDIARALTKNRDLLDIAAYFASQKQMEGAPIRNEAGEKLFNNVYRCVSCHGENGKGKPSNDALFPVIGGQHKNYLVKQLTDFKNGNRETDMSGTMPEVTRQMTDAEIEAVSDYLSGL